jgi:hypothetical protein
MCTAEILLFIALASAWACSSVVPGSRSKPREHAFTPYKVVGQHGWGSSVSADGLALLGGGKLGPQISRRSPRRILTGRHRIAGLGGRRHRPLRSGRLGYAWGPGMIYVTGGGAWASLDFNAGGR